MIKPFIQPVRRRRGNPNWGRPLPPAPAVATEFETQVRHLGLTKQTCTGSVALRYWCERNKNRCYIPEWLLEEWGIAVEPYVSGAAWSTDQTSTIGRIPISAVPREEGENALWGVPKTVWTTPRTQSMAENQTRQLN